MRRRPYNPGNAMAEAPPLAYKPRVLLVDNDYVPGPCWQLLGRLSGRSLSPHMYGTLRLIDGRTVTAHRWAYVAARGPIPAGMHVHHRCFNKLCINPQHLAMVTAGENSRLSNFEERLVA